MTDKIVTKFDKITLSRAKHDCVTIFTSDGPVQVEVGYFKSGPAVALRFITPPGMLVLRNELLDEQGNPCQPERNTFGKSISSKSTNAATSPHEPPAESSIKHVVDYYPQAKSKIAPTTIPPRAGTTG